MNTTTTTNILFDQVNLSSLQSIVNIYQNNRNDNNNDDQKRSPFTNHFGLPLSIASFENRVIGYAFVKFNNEGETEINSYWEKDFYSIEAEQDLKFHAQKLLIQCLMTRKHVQLKLKTLPIDYQIG